jgi:hypothetical protein
MTEETGMIVKKHWKVSLATFVSLFAVGIAFGFVYSGTLALPLTLIGILPPSVYYFYAEILDRPMVFISEKESAVEVTPMYAGIEDGPSDFARPALFYRISVENQGKYTAERARVQIQLSGENVQREFFARWSGPANSEEYDLLPGQRKDAIVLKLFLTRDFFERINGLKGNIEKVSDIDFDDALISPTGNPPGEMKAQDKLETQSFRPKGYTPREQRPEQMDRSVHGKWEGKEISITDKNLEDEISIRARVIADDYRTNWEANVGVFSFLSLIRFATKDDYWQQQWENQGLSDLMNRVRFKVQEWVDDYSESTS